MTTLSQAYQPSLTPDRTLLDSVEDLLDQLSSLSAGEHG